VAQKGAAISRYGPLVLRRDAPIRSDPGLTGHAMDAFDPPFPGGEVGPISAVYEI
jgi:hypothetical protein